MTDLEALLGELRTKADALAKAQPAPEVKITEPVAEVTAQAAAEAPVATEETVAKGGEVGAEAEAAKPEQGGDAQAAAAEATAEAVTEEGAGETAKSFKVKREDGTEVDAIDGFALIKALETKLDAALVEIAEIKVSGVTAAAVEPVDVDGLRKSFDEQTETMAKALATAMDALSASQTQVVALTQKLDTQAQAIAQQGALVKSLSDKVTEFGSTGRGRVSTVSVHEKPSPAAVTEAAPTVGELFAKANTLIATGKLNAHDASRVNAWVNSGRGIPPDLAALFAA